MQYMSHDVLMRHLDNLTSYLESWSRGQLTSSTARNWRCLTRSEQTLWMTTAPYRAMAGDSEPEVVARGETFSVSLLYCLCTFLLSHGSFGLCDLCYPKNSVIFHGQFISALYQELTHKCINPIQQLLMLQICRWRNWRPEAENWWHHHADKAK